MTPLLLLITTVVAFALGKKCCNFYYTLLNCRQKGRILCVLRNAIKFLRNRQSILFDIDVATDSAQACTKSNVGSGDGGEVWW